MAKEALEKRWQTEVLMLKDQLLVEQQSKGTLENSLTGEIDYLREQLGMMRSVHTQLDEEGKRKASLELALQQTKEQLTEVQDRASQSISIKVKIIFYQKSVLVSSFSHLYSRLKWTMRFNI